MLKHWIAKHEETKFTIQNVAVKIGKKSGLFGENPCV
jgi:hypothetical protein